MSQTANIERNERYEITYENPNGHVETAVMPGSAVVTWFESEYPEEIHNIEYYDEDKEKISSDIEFLDTLKSDEKGRINLGKKRANRRVKVAILESHPIIPNGPLYECPNGDTTYLIRGGPDDDNVVCQECGYSGSPDAFEPLGPGGADAR